MGVRIPQGLTLLDAVKGSTNFILLGGICFLLARQLRRTLQRSASGASSAVVGGSFSCTCYWASVALCLCAVVVIISGAL